MVKPGKFGFMVKLRNNWMKKLDETKACSDTLLRCKFHNLHNRYNIVLKCHSRSNYPAWWANCSFHTPWRSSQLYTVRYKSFQPGLESQTDIKTLKASKYNVYMQYSNINAIKRGNPGNPKINDETKNHYVSESRYQASWMTVQGSSAPWEIR